MSNYLIELTAIHCFLLMGYWLLLRNEKHYTIRRLYLITATIMALLIPFFKLPRLFLSNRESMNVIQIPAANPDAISVAPVALPSDSDPSQFLWIYIAISGFFLVKLIWNTLNLIRLEQSSTREVFNDLIIRRTCKVKGSFTFFNWIFLGEDVDRNQQDFEVMLKHEQAHVSYRHTYDIIFFQLFKVCFWWLPTSWFINREIKQIHEFQADNYVIKSHHIDHYSNILIISTLRSNGLSLASSFHDGLIQKRLKAMKEQTNNISLWKFGILGSLGLILFLVFACSEEATDEIARQDLQSQAIEDKAEVFTVVEEQPEFQGGMDAFYKYVQREIRYPLEARQKGVEGRVSVQFVVEKDGSISEVKAVNGFDSNCNEEAVRVIQNAPAFRPGKQRGKAIRVRMEIPVVFALDPDNNNEDASPKGMIVIKEVESINSELEVAASYHQGKWSGTVYDEEGNALPGANIVVAGTAAGTVSDLDGTFKVKADKTKNLVISFVGYKNVELTGNTIGN